MFGGFTPSGWYGQPPEGGRDSEKIYCPNEKCPGEKREYYTRATLRPMWLERDLPNCRHCGTEFIYPRENY